MSNDYSIDVTHPLEIQYDGEQFIPVSNLPKEIRFSTTASGWDIFTKTNFINSSPIALQLDDFKKRRYITASRLKTIVAKQMKGIQINEILDDTIYVVFDKVKTKTIKLQVDPKKVLLANGYKLSGTIMVEPSEVIVTGPSSLMKSIPDVVNLKLEAKDVSGNFEETVPVTTNLHKKLKLSNDKVKVKFETYQLEKVEVELSYTKLNFPKKKKIKILDDKVVLSYYARAEDLQMIKEQKLEALVDFKKLNEGTKTIKVTLKKVPDLIQSYQFEPAVVKISYGD